MTETLCETGDINRRTVLAATTMAAAASLGIDSRQMVFAQAAPPAAAAPSTAPAEGKVVLDRLSGGILLIGIDRQQTRNRIDPAVLIGLGKAYYQLDHDDSLRVAVLHGVGSDFVIGLDVAAFTAATAAGIFPVKDPDFIGPVGTTQRRAKPLVVAVQGATNNIGHELFLAADIRIAASDTVFGQAEVANASFPAGGGTVRFPREAGWGNAMRYILTGDKWSADEAFRMGLVQEVVPPGKQLDRATDIAKKIAAMAPLGVQAALASAHQAIAPEEAAFKSLLPEFQRLQRSDDAAEVRKALLEKRSPVFQGK